MERAAHPGMRYVVSRRNAGLGDRIICLGAAWLFARNTGRVLIADWRCSPYARDWKNNLFAKYFEPSRLLAGVEFIGDDRIAGLCLPRPIFPEFWNRDCRSPEPHFRSTEMILRDRDVAVTIIREGTDVPAPTVIFDACVNDGLVSLEDSRTFLSSLRPIPEVSAKVAGFRKHFFGAASIIGLHVRHGNAAEAGPAVYWESLQSAIDRCEDAICRARRKLGGEARLFLCTDSIEVQSAIRKRIPDVICRDKEFRQDEGELHLWEGAYRGGYDALIEMLLLARCDALIRYPPGSFFSFYAAAMRHWQGTPCDTVYDLHRPCDPADPLSPVLLL